MATYETTFLVDCPAEETFAFVSNFENAVSWDPRTFRARKLTDGPVRLGTRFVLTGGMLRKDALPARVPAALAGAMPLRYDVVAFDPPHELVLAGENLLVRYADRIEFTPCGARTRIRYAARLDLRGPLSLADGILQRLFRRIGDDATRDLPSAVAAALPP
jgi:dehydrogenase/reductase SDR family protein 12